MARQGNKSEEKTSRDWTANSRSVFGTLGASNHSETERASGDYYATDPRAIRDLKSVIPVRQKVWECACGGGHLSRELERFGHNVLSTDLVDRGYGLPDWDFLNITPVQWERVRGWAGNDVFDIVTNPPYKYATDFVLTALRLVPWGGRVMMFLRTLFLEGEERRRLIYNVNPPAEIFQFARRISCAPNGDFNGNLSRIQAYAWFVWEKSNDRMRTEIKWI